MSRTAKQGAHGYHDVFLSSSQDGGKSWSPPAIIPELQRAKQEDGYEVVAGDLWPKRHAKSGMVLLTGKTFNFANGTTENFLREKVSYAVIDPQTLHVLRNTEQILVPENNATLGNSGVCQISDNESWITVAEGRVSQGPRKGETNQVIVARLVAP